MLASRRSGGKRRTGPGVWAGSLWSGMASESRGLVVLVLIANGIIAVVKFIAARISGSSAMLAEGFHSVADGEVHSIDRLLTMQLSPQEVLVNVEVNLDPGPSGAEIDGVIERIDEAMKEAVPEATQVFIEPELVS